MSGRLIFHEVPVPIMIWIFGERRSNRYAGCGRLHTGAPSTQFDAVDPSHNRPTKSWLGGHPRMLEKRCTVQLIGSVDGFLGRVRFALLRFSPIVRWSYADDAAKIIVQMALAVESYCERNIYQGQ